MGLLCVGLDESTDQLQRNVFVVAGYLATQPDWCEIEHQWMQRLERQPSPISYFKTSEWKYLPGQFRQFRDQAAYPKPKGREAADAIKSDLEQIMRTSPVRGFGFGINLKDYRAVRRSSRARRIFGPNPYENAYLMTFIRVVGTCQEEMPSRVNSEIVAFLCDESNRSSNVKAVYDKLKEHNPRCGPWLGSLTYMDNEKSPALQAADLLAWNCREFITECL